MVQKRTLEEVKLQGNDEFQLSIDYAFIGFCIIRGVIKGIDEPLYSLWNSDYGRPIFRETMARNKFIDITQYIQFDDKSTRPRRRKNDKYAPIRELWETVITFKKAFPPR